MRRSSGFTLIELMMVVAILGILAVIAIPRYKAYLYRSKTAEGVAFLSEIKSRQESYRADFGQYCGDRNTTTFYPADSTKVGGQYVWEAAPTSGLGATFKQLGAYPPGNRTLFQYLVIAGPPGAANVPAGNLGFTGADFWFVSRAQADLDGDGTTMLMEGYSASSGIFTTPPSGYE
jgi:prepilin-type N-terminal cleavage/methylation domain-containing protein